jgi:TonB family protein
MTSWGNAQDEGAAAQSQPATPRSPHSTKADLQVPICPLNFDDSLATDGIASSSHKEGIAPPKPLKWAEAEMSDEVRRTFDNQRPYEFMVVVSAVVGVDGEPGNLCLKESSGYGLDANAAKAVEKYRFTPAMKDGQPVPWRLVVKVLFSSN